MIHMETKPCVVERMPLDHGFSEVWGISPLHKMLWIVYAWMIVYRGIRWMILCMIVMELNIDVCLQMTVASNCSNFTSVDLRVKPKTALNRAEVDESNGYSPKRDKPVELTLNLPQT